MVQPMPFISTLPAIGFHVWNIKRSLKRDPLAAGSRTPDLAVLCALLCDLGSWAPVPRLSDPPLGPRQGRCHPYGLMVEIQAIKMLDPIGDGGSYCLTYTLFTWTQLLWTGWISFGSYARLARNSLVVVSWRTAPWHRRSGCGGKV